MILGKRVTTLLIFLLMVTLVGFAVAIQGVRLKQDRIIHNVTQVTNRVTKVDAVVSRSPCANKTKAVCLRLLIAAASPGDRELLRGPRGRKGAQGAPGPRGPQGISGTRGAAGRSVTGNRGLRGLRGFPGPQGLQGPKGDNGTPAPAVQGHLPGPLPGTRPASGVGRLPKVALPCLGKKC